MSGSLMAPSRGAVLIVKIVPERAVSWGFR